MNMVDKEWESVINASENENLTWNEYSSYIDLLIKNEKEIFVLRTEVGEHEDIEQIVSIIIIKIF